MQGERTRLAPGLPTRPQPRIRARRRAGGIFWLNLVAAVLVGTGITVALVGHDTLRWAPPPLPPAWAARHLAGPPRYAYAGSARLLRPSVPVTITIPAIRVRARIMNLGLARDGSIAVPSLRTPFLAGWYDRGPAPGARGAAVIVGHVDALGVGPAVFYKLGSMRPGNRIYVRLRAGRTAVFEAYSVAEYAKTRFPTARVYGYTSWPTLRLVTCGGDYDPRTGHYLGNTVVFATYVGQGAR